MTAWDAVVTQLGVQQCTWHCAQRDGPIHSFERPPSTTARGSCREKTRGYSATVRHQVAPFQASCPGRSPASGSSAPLLLLLAGTFAAGRRRIIKTLPVSHVAKGKERRRGLDEKAVATVGACGLTKQTELDGCSRETVSPKLHWRAGGRLSFRTEGSNTFLW